MELELLRLRIDSIDEKILELIHERLSLMPQIAEIKLKKNLKLKQPKREKEVIEKMKSKAVQMKISPDLVEKIFKEVIKESRRLQEGVKL